MRFQEVLGFLKSVRVSRDDFHVSQKRATKPNSRLTDLRAVGKLLSLRTLRDVDNEVDKTLFDTVDHIFFAVSWPCKSGDIDAMLLQVLSSSLSAIKWDAKALEYLCRWKEA